MGAFCDNVDNCRQKLSTEFKVLTEKRKAMNQKNACVVILQITVPGTRSWTSKSQRFPTNRQNLPPFSLFSFQFYYYIIYIDIIYHTLAFSALVFISLNDHAEKTYSQSLRMELKLLFNLVCSFDSPFPQSHEFYSILAQPFEKIFKDLSDRNHRRSSLLVFSSLWWKYKWTHVILIFFIFLIRFCVINIILDSSSAWIPASISVSSIYTWVAPGATYLRPVAFNVSDVVQVVAVRHHSLSSMDRSSIHPWSYSSLQDLSRSYWEEDSN